MTEQELDDYLAIERYRQRYLQHPKRAEFERRRDNGEARSVEEWAKFFNEPIDDFSKMYGAYLGWESIKPMLGTEH